MNDPLDALLTPSSVPPGEELRRAAWDKPERVLRRRRLVRRFGYAAGLAACYLAGLLTMHLLPAPPPEVRERVVYVEPPAPPALAPALSPVELEREALAQLAAPRADLLRQAGDLYAEQHHDLEAALRCYTRALDAGDETPVSANDHWLLMAIKDARKKEKTDAKNSD